MEETNDREDIQANLFKQMSMLPAGTLRSNLSRSSTPRNSPTYRKLRTPRREVKGGFINVQWFRGNRLILWLLLISLWAYIGFHIQSRWAHSEHNKAEFIGYTSVRTMHTVDNVTKLVNTLLDSATESRDQLLMKGNEEPVSKTRDISMIGRTVFPSRPNVMSKKSSKTKRHLRSRSRGRGRLNVESANETDTYFDDGIPRRNTSYGLLVGPFGKTVEAILDWSAEKRKISCDRSTEFAHIVWSRKFVLIFHELSMTGAPLSMMELATEILNCGGKVSVVVLTRRGGLIGELNRRRIKVLEDKGKLSFKTATRADLIIAGSAVCSSWIEQYLAYSTAGSSQILWWIMENRREYFDRSKRMLNQVKKLAFLSDAQSKQWLSWCQDEHIQLKTNPAIAPLSVNDELAHVAGFPDSHNTTLFTAEKMLAKRNLMRVAMRKEMGIADDDMLVMSLSSINPAKGQLLLLESASLMAGQNITEIDFNISTFMGIRNVTRVSFQVKQNRHRGMLPQKINRDEKLSDTLLPINDTGSADIKKRKKHPKLTRLYRVAASDNKSPGHLDTHLSRNLLSSKENRKEPSLKLLIGSVGSKSNKTPYVKEILKFLTLNSNLSKSLLWTPATTHVASLYTAADVYVINAQGIGETFGRVTIEAMAFGLPVLGTDAGGTREIVEDRVTGLLHPIGREGVKPLAQNLRLLLYNPSVRKQLGDNGRLKVEKMYLKQHMFQKLADVLLQCLNTK